MIENKSLNVKISEEREKIEENLISKELTKIELINKSLEEDKKNINLLLALVKEYEKVEEYENAEKVYKKILNLTDNYNEDLYFSLAKVLILQEKYEEAAKVFTNVRKIQNPCGVSEKPYKKDTKLQNIVHYTQFYDQYNVEENIVLFESFSAEAFSDNPYALFKEMLSNNFFNNWNFIWVLNNEELLPDQYKRKENIKVVKRHSDAYLKYLTIAKVLINNAVFPMYFIKKDEQVYINTWHGTPWKTLGNDNPMQNGNTARNFIQANYLVSPNSHTSNVYLNGYGIKGFFKGTLLESGYPRIDSLINSSTEDQKKIKEILNIKNNKPIILYAPTYKGLWSNPNIEANEIIEYIDNLKNDEYNIIFRGHYFVESIIKDSMDNVTVAPHSIDSCELLAVVDILITDYSSIFFDFLPLKRPIFLFVPDYEEYKQERGLYFELNEVPGFVTKDINKLKENLYNATIKPTLYTENYEKYINTFSLHEDGKSSKRVIEQLITKLENKKIKNKKIKNSIIIYPGKVKELCDLKHLEDCIENIDQKKFDIYLLFNRTELVSNKDVKHKIDSIKGVISSIEYSGEPNKTLEERWLFSKIKNATIKLNKEQEQIITKFYEREFKRLFSNNKFTYGIILEPSDARIELVFSSKNIKEAYIFKNKNGTVLKREGSKIVYLDEEFNTERIKLITASL